MAKVASIGSFEKIKENLLEIWKSNPSKPRNYKCADCRDMFWLDVIELVDGGTLRAQEEVWFVMSDQPERVSRKYCVPCPKCVKRKTDEAVHERGQYRDGEYVDLKLISKYWAKKKSKEGMEDPATLARNVPRGSILLYGETGRFKTLTMQYWYNRLLAEHMGDPQKLHWIHENQLTHLAQNDACLTLVEELRTRGVTDFFYEELLYPINWRAREKGGHYSDMVLRGFMNLFDFFSLHKNDIRVLASGNYLPQDVLKEPESEPLLRRMVEVFNHGQGMKKI